MTSRLEFGVDQFSIDLDLVPAPLGWDEGQVLDLMLVFLQQIVRQADRPVSVVSDSAVGDRDFQHIFCSLRVGKL